MPQGAPAVPFIPLECLIETTYQHVQGLGYHPMYLRECRKIWRAFVRFAVQEAHHECLSEALMQFLDSRGIAATLPTAALSSHQRVIRAAMRMLTACHLHGCYQPRRGTAQHVTLPPSFQRVVEAYEGIRLRRDS